MLVRELHWQRPVPGVWAVTDTMPVTDDIVAFIRARLDEDADLVETIREGGFHAPTWTSQPNEEGTWPILCEPDDSTPIGYITDGRWEIQHVARHDPARVLRGVEAKRRIVAECEYNINYHLAVGARAVLLATVTLKLLASEWSDHADYQQEWAP